MGKGGLASDAELGCTEPDVSTRFLLVASVCTVTPRDAV